MSSDDHFEDIWTLESGTSNTQPKPPIQIKQIDGVVPLDDQFGIHPLKTVPDALQEPLFGDPALKTYAILDAAKVTNLAELVEDSGLEYRCLFKGDAFDELKDVAPWIVRLEDGNAFTRNLFTQTDAQWHLWDQEPGIYLRSGGTLDDMWKHFRKFTRVQDEDAKWYYWRFWESKWLIGQLIGMPLAQIDSFLPPQVHSLVVLSGGKVETISKNMCSLRETTRCP